MDTLTASVTLKALDGLTLRSIATSQNIANANTPGYRPVRVDFETALARAAASRNGQAVAALEPSLSEAAGADGQLRLDLELATASATTMRYAALIEVLGRQMDIDALAVSRNS